MSSLIQSTVEGGPGVVTVTLRITIHRRLLLGGLDCAVIFPWSGNNASIKDITSLLSECPPKSYLSSFHIDHTIRRISEKHRDLHGPEVSGHHILTTVDILGTIKTFYGSRRKPVKVGNALWEHLMKIENQVIEGEVDSVGGVYHLPLHWVSVIFNIQEGRILYGDSLNQPLPKPEHYAFIQWVKHLRQRSNLVNVSISVQLLPTGNQDDSASCGLFVLNAIGHHHLGHPLLSPDQKLLVCDRMEIALDILHANTVRPSLIIILDFYSMNAADR